MRLMKIALVVAVASLSLALVACGDDNSSTTTTVSTSPTSTTPSGGSSTTPGYTEEAKQRCLDTAKKLPTKQAQETGKKICENPQQASEDAQQQATNAAATAKQTCLDAAKGIPDDNARKQAEKTCKALPDN